MSRLLRSSSTFVLLAAALALSGCPAPPDPGHGQGHEDDAHGGHGHSHGDDGKTEALTVFSPRHELFIEHGYLLVGKPTRFVTHVTDVVACEGRVDGPVTFIVQQGDGPELEHEVLEPARLGIYLSELTFPKAGEWKLSLRIPHPDGDDLVPLPDRIVYANQAELDAAPEQNAPEGISFLKEQQWRLDFQTTEVAQRTLVERLQLASRLCSPPSKRAVASLPIGGRLLPPEGDSLPVLGQEVEAGQVLGRVQPLLAGADHLEFLSSRQQLTALRVELQTQAAAARSEATVAKVALERAEKQLARVELLAEREAKSQREVELAVADREQAAAQLRAAQARERLLAEVEQRLGELPAGLAEGYPAVDVVAPIAGVIVQASGAQGEQVAAGAPLFTILDRSTLQLVVHVPEFHLGKLPKEPHVLFSTHGERGVFREVLGAGGKLLLRPLLVDHEIHSARLVYELPNPGDLAAEMAAEAFVATRTAAEALAIPASALVEEEGRYLAFVMLGGETFAKRDLTLGVRDGEWVEVRAGLRAGERVVSRGAYAVKLASVVTSDIGHGHAH